jgi:hypothetical protein
MLKILLQCPNSWQRDPVMGGKKKERRRALTSSFVNHMHLQSEVFLVDTVLRRMVEVELL